MKAAEPASNSVPIKHTRPKVQKFDNGFIIEDTHMGPAQGKVGSCFSSQHARNICTAVLRADLEWVFV